MCEGIVRVHVVKDATVRSSTGLRLDIAGPGADSLAASLYKPDEDGFAPGHKWE